MEVPSRLEVEVAGRREIQTKGPGRKGATDAKEKLESWRLAGGCTEGGGGIRRKVKKGAVPVQVCLMGCGVTAAQITGGRCGEWYKGDDNSMREAVWLLKATGG